MSFERGVAAVVLLGLPLALCMVMLAVMVFGVDIVTPRALASLYFLAGGCFGFFAGGIAGYLEGRWERENGR